MSHGWGFDFDFRVPKEGYDGEGPVEYEVDENGQVLLESGTLEEKMERRVAVVAEQMKLAEDTDRGFGISATREKNLLKAKKRKAILEKRQAVEKSRAVR